MTVGAWLASRTPAPPAALRERLEALLAPHLGADESQLPDLCLAAAARLVQSLLDEGRTGRESALDLLAADALVTYAFEAGSTEPATLAPRAAAALRTLLALA